MKKYLPILVFVFFAIALILGIKQMRTPQNKSSIAPLTTTIVPTGAKKPGGAVPSVTGTISRGAAITLAVNTPSDNTTVTSGSIEVRGKTVPDAEVFVNDAEAKADGNGNFAVTISLDEGENYILVVANDAQGNYSEKEITVIYEAN